MPLHGFDYRLRWADFRKIKESMDGSHDAQVVTAITYKLKFWADPNQKWKVTSGNVVLSLRRPAMWVVKGKESAALLSHEQGHYDIAALAARTLYARLKGLSGDGSQDPNDTATKLAQEIIGEQAADGTVIASGFSQQIQDLYDEGLVCGSNHGTHPTNQGMWKHRILKAKQLPQGSLDELLLICPGDFSLPSQIRG